MVPAAVGFHCPDDAREGARSVRQPRTVYGGRPVDRPVVTPVLVGINVVVFLATAVGGTSLAFGGGASPLYAALAMQPVAFDSGTGPGVVQGVADGQLWRLVTAMFLHFGVAHIVLNVLALLHLGPALEPALGRLRFLTLYMLSGVAGTVASYAFGPVLQRSAGASGAIFGLAAAAYVLERRRGGAEASSYAVLLGVNLVLTFVVPFIDVRGHLGGLVGGALVAGVFVLTPPGPRRGLLHAAGCLALAGLLAVVVVLRTAALNG